MLSDISACLRNLLPLKQLVCVCEFTQKTTLPCFHETVFPAYFYTLLDRMPPDLAKTRCRFQFPENGKTHYKKGDKYIFSIVLFGHDGQSLACQLVKCIDRGIDSTDRRTLHNNLKVIELYDGFHKNKIKHPSDLQAWQYEDLIAQRKLLIKSPNIRLQFNSGVIFKNNLFLSKDFHASRLLQQLCLGVLYATELEMAKKTQTATAVSNFVKNKSIAPDSLVDYTHLFFVNKTYANSEGDFKHLSGYHGVVDISWPKNFSLIEPYLDLLIVCQYLGLGKRTNYGLGQYQLLVNGTSYKHTPKRAQPLLKFTLNLNTLIKLPDYAKLNDAQRNLVLTLREQVLSGNYKSAPLKTFKKTSIGLNGKQKTRTLSTAPLPERVMQKAVAKYLSQVLDNAQHPASYGYRPKRDRKQAVEAVSKNIKYGKNWVLETDIENCFDEISLDVVQIRLQCLFNDIELTRFVLEVLCAPLINNEKTDVSIGIPQGCPLSPLIANIVLTDLDYDLSLKGFSHIRFADDLVICGNSRSLLEQARLVCEQSLGEHGLKLNQSKTKITQAAENFIFLGYEIDEKQAVDLSHLNNPRNQSGMIGKIEQVDSPPIGLRGQVLFVCYQKHAQLTLSANHLVISSGEKIERTPLSHIRLIILLGGHYVTTPLSQYCLRNNIDIYYLSHTGKYLGMLSTTSATNQYKTMQWILQETYLTQDDTCLSLSKNIVQARLHNMRKTLVNYQCENIKSLEIKLRQVKQAKDLHELRGYEGVATRFYYLQINHLIEKTGFLFERRTRRPPKDPFNVLLSLGYTILYNYLNSFLLTLNLNPDRGFYHYTQSNSLALCSDLIEPFRHWIERAAITVVRRKQIQVKHFYYHSNYCCLNAEGRKVYIRHIAQMLESNSKHGNIFKQRNIEKIYRQAVDFKKHIQHPSIVLFDAYREA